MEQEVIKAELSDCNIFVEKANYRFMILEASLRRMPGDALNLIHDAIEVKKILLEDHGFQ